MSQFDFPRIHYFGKTILNPATGNNDFHFPLVIYDPVQTKAVIPPRLYLDNVKYTHETDIATLLAEIPEEIPILQDSADRSFIEIRPVDTISKFKEWAVTPLGKHPIDQSYYPLYKAIKGNKSLKPLIGEHPGYWNYYGDMTFSFENVKVVSVQLQNENGTPPQLFTTESPVVPQDVAPFLGASLDMQDLTKRNTGVMIDPLPTCAIASQVFCDRLVLSKPDSVLMSGNPGNGILRQLNWTRVVNQHSVLGASGTFYSTISTEELKGGEDSPIIQFFQQHAGTEREIAGVFVRYNMFEVYEERYPDYQQSGKNANPATAHLMGSLSPWYKGEMRNMSMARPLIAESPFLPDKTLSHLLWQPTSSGKTISLDLSASLPETKADPELLDPVGYSTYELGELTLELETEAGKVYPLGTLQIDETHLSRAQFIRTGGMLDLPCPTFAVDLLDQGLLRVRGRTLAGDGATFKSGILAREPLYTIGTDQSILYTEAGTDPALGYRSSSGHPEPCYLSILSRGKPVQHPIRLYVMAYREVMGKTVVEIQDLFAETKGMAQHGQKLLFPTPEPDNVLYYFMPHLRFASEKVLLREFSNTGHFLNLRVLPAPDFSAYLGADNPDNLKPIPFSLLYQEIFGFYESIYPIAAEISPFYESSIQRSIPYLLRIMAPENWASSTYMPSSRELSASQFKLFSKWAQQVQNQTDSNQTNGQG